jgi:hypothetical protein
MGVMIHLHIEELVLHGFDPHDRHAIGDAVAAELRRLIDHADDFSTAPSRAVNRTSGGAVRFESNRPPASQAGTGIAMAIRRGAIAASGR